MSTKHHNFGLLSFDEIMSLANFETLSSRKFAEFKKFWEDLSLQKHLLSFTDFSWEEYLSENS